MNIFITFYVRLQQLTAERAPITSHIGTLESHIGHMYQELVTEFESKKSVSCVLELKSQKISLLSSKISKLKAEISSKEQYMISFKRELSNIAISMTGGKELEDAVRSLYKKYVREEKLLTHTGGRIVSKRTLNNVSQLIKEERDTEFDDYYQGKWITHIIYFYFFSLNSSNI